MAEVWGTIGKFKNFPSRISESDEKVISNMEKFILEYCSQTASYNKPPENSIAILETKIEIDVPFTIQELNLAIKILKEASSPGLDTITNTILNN